MIGALPYSVVAEAMRELDTDDLVDILEDLDAAGQVRILDALEMVDRVAVEQAMSYPEGAAGRLMQREAVYAFQYEGKRYDCGSKEGFLEATVELALQHPQVGASFREYLKGLSL